MHYQPLLVQEVLKISAVVVLMVVFQFLTLEVMLLALAVRLALLVELLEFLED